MLGSLFELGTPEIVNPHDKETEEETEEEIVWIDDDPFTTKPQDQT